MRSAAHSPVARWAAVVSLFLLFTIPAEAQWTASRPDGHAPIGVMGDHTHEAGEFMFSYRYMRMYMEGSRVGTDGISDQGVLADFMVTPVDMTMDMHMLGGMYAPTDWLTVMGMVPILDNSMDHLTRMGGSFTTESGGLGDIRLSGLLGLKRDGALRVHATAGVSIPTGSIEETDVTPASAPAEAQLPYPMQVGSGTVDLLPGLTVLGMTGRGSWGLQGSGVIRLAENDRDYTFGDELHLTGWLAYRLTDRLSASARAAYRQWGDIQGADAAFGNLIMVPTVRTDLRAGTRIDVPLGLNYWFDEGALAGHRVAVEFAVPVYQDLDGPQLETDWVLTLGWQKSFAPLGHGH